MAVRASGACATIGCAACAIHSPSAVTAGPAVPGLLSNQRAADCHRNGSEYVPCAASFSVPCSKLSGLCHRGHPHLDRPSPVLGKPRRTSLRLNVCLLYTTRVYADSLGIQDAKVVDNACVSLAFIAEASVGQPRLLEALTGGGLVGEALQMVSGMVRSRPARRAREPLEHAVHGHGSLLRMPLCRWRSHPLGRPSGSSAYPPFSAC
jgi:hypothetical protein